MSKKQEIENTSLNATENAAEEEIQSVPLCTSKVFISLNKGQSTIVSQGALDEEENLLMILEKTTKEKREHYFEQILDYLQDDVNNVVELIAPIAIESDVFLSHPIEFDIEYRLDEENHVFACVCILEAIEESGYTDELTARDVYCLDFAETYAENTILEDTCDILEACAKYCTSGPESLDYLQRLLLGFPQE